MTRPLRVAAAVAGLALAAGCGSTSSGAGATSAATTTAAASPTSVQMMGFIDLDRGLDSPHNYLTLIGEPGNTCEGTGGYSDITTGAAVTVYDASGTVVGVGALEQGKRVGAQVIQQCRFTFIIPGLPVGKFYKVEVSHRGQATVTAAGVGDVELSLGS
jgi:hypothetical protein